MNFSLDILLKLTEICRSRAYNCGLLHMNPWALMLSDPQPILVLLRDNICPFQCHCSYYY